MLHIQTLVQAKKTARALEKALLKAGLELKHGKALDALAAMCGQLDWNSYAKSLDPSVLDKQLRDFERSHMEHTGDEDYGREAMLVAHTGFQLRYSAETEMCDYIRVCDPLGRELMYWHSDEWAEDPQLVMGAVLGALVRGGPMPVPKASRKAQQTQAPARAQPRVQDIDFFAAHAVICQGRSHSIAWREEAVLALLAQPGTPAFEEQEEETALQLSYENDGFVHIETLSLGKLASLRWSATHKSFIDDEGETYQFFFEVSASDWFNRPVAAKQVGNLAGEGLAAGPAPSATQNNAALALYAIRGMYFDRKSSAGMAIETRVAGFSRDDAQNRVCQVYDNSAQVLRVDEVTPVAESQAGPFSVYVDGGIYDTVPYLQQAVDLAEILAPTGADEVTVEDKDQNTVWRLDATGEEA